MTRRAWSLDLHGALASELRDPDRTAHQHGGRALVESFLDRVSDDEWRVDQQAAQRAWIEEHQLAVVVIEKCYRRAFAELWLPMMSERELEAWWLSQPPMDRVSLTAPLPGHVHPLLVRHWPLSTHTVFARHQERMALCREARWSEFARTPTPGRATRPPIFLG